MGLRFRNNCCHGKEKKNWLSLENQEQTPDSGVKVDVFVDPKLSPDFRLGSCHDYHYK